MIAEVLEEKAVALAPGFRLQWEEAQQAHVLLYPEGMVTLNETATAILQRCDGRTVEAVVRDLQRRFPDAELREDVLEFIEVARGEGWLQFR